MISAKIIQISFGHSQVDFVILLKLVLKKVPFLSFPKRNGRRQGVKCQDESWKEWSFFNKKRLEYQKEYHSRLSKHQTRKIRENVTYIWKCFCGEESAVELRVLDNDSEQLDLRQEKLKLTQEFRF